tara:strand:- start:48 stop:287 length:240 start_codon:yes stop_codon:yes gene_type:complete
MLITIVGTVIASLMVASQVLLYARVRKLEATKEHLANVLQGVALSNLQTTKRMVETAARQQAIVSYLGMKFETQEDVIQ